MRDWFGYQGKSVVITGAASGIGGAVTKLLIELGAEIYALDIRPVSLAGVTYVPVDLGQRLSIDAASEKLPRNVDKIFACAGIDSIGRSDVSPLDVVMVNFVGHRYLIELLVPRMTEGGAIAMIASFAAVGLRKHIETIKEMLLVNDFDQAKAWLEANADNPQVLAESVEVNRPYSFSKECLVLYAKQQACRLARRNIRINAVSPGVCETPLTRAVRDVSDLLDDLTAISCRTSVPEEQAEPLIFLNSDMARYVSGADLAVDFGASGAAFTGQFYSAVRSGNN